MNTDTEIVARPRWILRAMRAAMAATVEAVRHVLRRAVVAGRNDMPVEHDDRADPIPMTVGARAYCQSDAHEVFFRGRTSLAVAVHVLPGSNGSAVRRIDFSLQL